MNTLIPNTRTIAIICLTIVLLACLWADQKELVAMAMGGLLMIVDPKGE